MALGSRSFTGLEGYGSPGSWAVKEQLLLFDGGVAPRVWAFVPDSNGFWLPK